MSLVDDSNTLKVKITVLIFTKQIMLCFVKIKNFLFNLLFIQILFENANILLLYFLVDNRIDMTSKPQH